VIAEPRALSFHLCASLLYIAAVSLTLSAQETGQTEIDRYSRQAQQAMAAKNWDEAAKVLEKLARLAPDVPEIQGNLGMAYYSQNRIFEAAKAFERTLKLNPKMTQATLLLGLCYAELGRNEEAVKILGPAFRYPPDKPMGRLIGLGLQRAHTALKQYPKAAAVADELVSRYPDDPEILFHASRLHADQAYQMMTRLMQAAPDSVWVHYANAQVHESLQRYDLAVAEYRTVLEMEPRLPGVHFRLGRVLLLRSRDSKALDDAKHEFEEDLAIAPQNSDAEYELGEIYRERGQFELALEHFFRAVHYHPEFAEAQIGLSRTLINLGRAQEALPHLTEAVRLDPQNKVPHFLLGSVYKSMGDKARYQTEMAAFQKLHEAGSLARVSLPSRAGSSEVTQQTLGSEMSPQP
jgi:tetratricopeptide (TPR) repeat protein